MMKKPILTFVVFLMLFNAFAQSNNYQKIKVYANFEQLKAMAKAGLCVDHGELLPGKFLINVFSEWEIEKIKSLNITYDVLIDDMQSYIKERNKNYQKKITKATCATNAPDYKTPENFQLGSFAGYFTYDEMLANLDSMQAKYPNLISKRMIVNDSIKTIEGRDLYYVRLSDNPEMDEDEPEVFYNALHHAREPLSMQHLIFYMWYLLENYDTDDDVKRAVNHVEMYFLPCINPDGYIHDYTISPEGGGFWRKNRKENEDGTFGVDLNRNYGHNWGYDDVGSSPDTESPVYRGTGPFSEPETQMIKAFCENHEFLITLNCHTSGNLLIYPYGYDYSLFTPDSAQFVNYAEVMTKYNDYTYGTGDQTVNYIVNGDSDDWMYHETPEKNKILSMTPESGRPDYGFYPPLEEIITICKDNVWQNLQAANLTLGYIEVEDQTPLYLSDKNGHIKLNSLRLGMQNESVIISLRSNDQISSEDKLIVDDLELLEAQLDSISYTIADDVVSGSLIDYDIVVLYTEKTETFSYQKIYMPEPVVVFEDAFENNEQWEGEWNITNKRNYAGDFAFTDTPDAGTEDFAGERLTSETINYIDLSNKRSAVLECYAVWDILARYDFAQISVKTRTSRWTPLCGNYTKAGNGFQDEFEPLYDGFRVNWVKDNFSLNDFVGEEIKIQVKTSYGFFTENEGFYIDEMKLIAQENLLPTTEDDFIEVKNTEEVSLMVLANDSDPEIDPLSISITQMPKQGTVSVENDVIIYKVNENVVAETDTLFYEACDQFGGCNEAMVVLELKLDMENLAPTAEDDMITITDFEPVSIAVLNNDTDPSNETLSIEIIQQPVFGAVIIQDYGNPSITYSLNENIENEEADQLTYVACNESGLCDTAQVFITIEVISSTNDLTKMFKELIIYPNPADELIYVDQLTQQGQLTLYNKVGQEIHTCKHQHNKTEIDTSIFEEGIYYIRFSNEDIDGFIGKLFIIH